MDEPMVTVQVDGYYERTIPKSKLQKMLDSSNEMIEEGIKAGLSREESEQIYGIKVIREME